MQKQKIRRKDRAITAAEATNILLNGEYGFLATCDADGQNYATPLSYIFLEGKIYFHTAQTGKKLHNIKHNPKVCFTVVGATKPIYDKDFTTYYESVMALGQAEEVTEQDEKYKILYLLAEKYLPEHMDKADKDISASLSRTGVFCIVVEEITGKAKRKSVKKSDAE